MGDDQAKPQVQLDADLQRQIRDGRKFTVAEAIGRMGGPGMMKGASPITQKQQADAELQSFLERRLNTPAGALSAVLLRQVQESELLLKHLEQPLVALATYVQSILDSDYRLQELVRESDAEWGRTYGERPYFEKAGCPADPEDPYTVASVRASLSQLAEELKTGSAILR
jgi:hypothetical protein